MAAVEIGNIQKSYGKKQVLQGVSLQADKGECVGILGCNGSGKSTLLSILAGIQKHEQGSFFYQGKDLFLHADLRKKVLGYVPQGVPLIEELSALDNLKLWYGKEELRQELSGGRLALLGIDSFVKVPVCKMSGGMKKRLSIGCAIAGNPEILLMDEPSAALDIVCKEKIYTYLDDFKKQGGIVLIATHDAQEMELCDKWYVMKDGGLTPYEFDGNLHTLVEHL